MVTRLVADKLSKIYGRQTVLDAVTFAVGDRDRIGLIGRNGAGKTTLLRILTGQETPDLGAVTLGSDTRLGILDQDRTYPDPAEDPETAVAYLMREVGRPEWEARKLAARFGLGSSELEAAPAQLSGGYQMRLELVRMLFGQPNLLLLDEPVNYLDLPTLVHLERFMRDWHGSFIVTSHDRELLRNLCQTTWDLTRGKLSAFRGDVDTYLDWREEQEEYVRRTNKRLRREINQAQKFVTKFRSKARQASRAQSKIKHISKLRTKLRHMDSDLPTAGFSLHCPSYVKGTALECLDLSIGYGNGRTIVASGINLDFPRGAKVGIVGENGRGKTTLLRTIAGTIDPLEGRAKWWHKADIGYFSQDPDETVNRDSTVLQALYNAASAETSGERILATAGAFLFREDDLEKKVRVLSGGERSRLRLACLALGKHNVLLLDEPTNHLDVETVEVLAKELQQYEGTVVLVSHARTFMNSVAERIYEVGDGTVRQYLDGYEQYVAELAERAESDSTEAEAGDGAGLAKRSEEAEARRQAKIEARRRQRERQRLEKELAALEKEKGKIMRFFFENPTEYDPDKQRRLTELESEIARLEEGWLTLEG